MRKANLYIPANLVCLLLQEVQKHVPYETGGVIAGEFVNDFTWQITHLATAGPKAIHGSYSYTPDYEHDEKKIARIYKETNCKSVYLGDWHSHPGAAAYMSEKDKNTLRTIARSEEARIEHPIMLILGTSPLELCCWTYNIKSKPFGKVFIHVPITLSNSTL